MRENVTTRGVVTTTDAWLAHHLTGTAFVTDVTTASRSLLTDIDTTEWDCELLELFGLEREPLPTIVANDAVVGTTTAFGAPAAVGGLIVDQQAALLAQRCTSPGSAKCTFGTGVFLLANVGAAPVRPTSGLTCSVAWTLRGETAYCVDGQAYTAASAIRWIADLGLIDSPADLDGVAAPDAGGVLFVPALAGLASPWWRPDATATFTGMTLSTTREHLVTAVIEGVAAQTAELLGSVSADLDAPLRSLRVDGGLTRSQRLMQALANLSGLPIEVYPSAHATALGAAACARLSGDPHLTLAEAVPDPASERIYQPQWSADQAEEFRSRWLTVVAASLPQERHV
jgi:glycerol kinase